MRAPPITSLNRKCLAFATRLSLCAKRCFDPQPLHALQLIVLRTDYVALHSASSMLKREHCRCALWLGILESMSNGESKIALFKAALCYGFAIALRALFLGILPCSPSLAEGARGWVIASEHNVRAWQPTDKDSS